MKNKLTAVLLAIMLVIVSVGCATSSPPEEDAPLVTVTGSNGWPVRDGANIATLGEEYVPATFFAYFFTTNHQSLQHNAMMNGHFDMEAFWNMEQDGVPIRQMLVDESMIAAMEYIGFYRLGFALGITQSAEDRATTDEFIAQMLDDLDGDYDQFTQAYRLTPDQLRDVMRMLNIAYNYFRQTLDDITVTEQALREIYDASPELFDQVTVRHVLIGVSDEMSEGERTAATMLAEVLLARINDGEEIGVLAAQYSEDPGSRDNNGEYTFGVGMMVPEFEQWAFAASPGDTGIVLTQFGYHVMQLMSRAGFEELDTSVLEERARFNIFQENHRALYDLIASDAWVFDQELIDKFAASI